jgi:hypothetical protein
MALLYLYRLPSACGAPRRTREMAGLRRDSATRVGANAGAHPLGEETHRSLELIQ